MDSDKYAQKDWYFSPMGICMTFNLKVESTNPHKQISPTLYPLFSLQLLNLLSNRKWNYCWCLGPTDPDSFFRGCIVNHLGRERY